MPEVQNGWFRGSGPDLCTADDGERLVAAALQFKQEHLCMKMIHLTKTDGGYFIVDETEQVPSKTPTFRPISNAPTEESCRTELNNRGVPDDVIEQAVRKVNETENDAILCDVVGGWYLM
jgi:hypothetical protein